MADPFQITILGPLGVRSGAGWVTISAPKERHLLGVLSLHRDEMMSVDRLAEELWGERGPDDPVASLRVVVSRLRGRLALVGDGVEIRTVGAGYALRLGDDHLDAALFRGLVAKAAGLMDARSWAEASAVYRTALSLWRGEVLSDLDLGVDSLPAIERLHAERVQATEGRIEADLECGRHAGLIGELHELVLDHRHHEPFTRQLMVSLARSGRQAEALRAATSLRAALAEVGLHPSPAIVSLEGEILNHDPTVTLSAATSSAATSSAATSTRPNLTRPNLTRPNLTRPNLTSPATEPLRSAHLPEPGEAALAPIVGIFPDEPGRAEAYPLVGRSDELRQLDRLRAEAATGDQRVAVVAGEAGIGKTRLVGEAIDRARDEGWIVLSAACDPQQLRPYHCVMEAVRPLIATVGPRRRRDLVMFDPDALDHVRGGVRSATESRAEGFAELGRLLGEAGRTRPILFVLDDVQWIDPPAAAAVRSILDGTVGAPIMVLLAIRDSEIEPGTTGADLLTHIARFASTSRIELGGMAEADVIELVTSLLGRPLGDDECRGARSVWVRSGGNPYVAGEWARDLIQGGRLAQVPAGVEPGAARADLPAAARVLLADRMLGLSTELRRVLDAAAVLGPEFDVALLARVCGDPDATIRALDEGERRRLVAAVSSDGRFAFSHALVRETLVTDLPVARRIFLHDRIAAVLEERPDAEAHLERLAFHSLGAAALRPERAVRHGARAGAAALSALGFEDAARLYRRCLELIAVGAPTPATLRADVAYGLAECMFMASMPGFDQAWTNAVETARRSGDPERLARAALIVPVWNDVGVTGMVDERRRAVAEEALDALPAGADALRSRLLSALARQLPPGAQRRSVIEEAVVLADRTGVPRAQLDALVTVVDLGGPDVDLAAMGRRADHLVSLDEDEIGGRGAAVLAVAEQAHIQATADRTRLGGTLVEMRRRADRSGQPYFRSMAAWWEVDQAILAGPLAVAEERFADAVELTMSCGIPQQFAMVMSGNVLGLLRYHQGRLGELESTAAAIASIWTASDSAWAFAAMAALEAGNRVAAAEIVARVAATHFEGVARDAVWLPSVGILGLVAARLGDLAVAEEVLALVEPYSGLWGWDYVATVGPVDFIIGELQLACGRAERARWYLGRAVSAAREVGAAVWEAWGTLQLGAAHAALGDHGQAPAFHSQALRIARRGGFEGVLAHAAVLEQRHQGVIGR